MEMRQADETYNKILPTTVVASTTEFKRDLEWGTNGDKEKLQAEKYDYFVIPYINYKIDLAPGLKEGGGYGMYGYKKKILTYNPSAVRHFLAPFLTPELTVCNGLSLWAHHFFYLAYTFAVMFYCTFNSYPDGHFGAGWTCKNKAGTSKNLDMCLLESILDDAKSEFRFLIAFILAGYVGAAVSSWNYRRKIYGTLCGRTRNLMMLISSSIPIPDKQSNDDGLFILRSTLNRWVMLAYELANLKAQGLMDDDEGQQLLVNKGLLLPGEWEAMVPGDRHTSVFFWIDMKIVNGVQHKHFSDSNSGGSRAEENILSAVSEMRGSANDMMDSICTDAPIPYVALCGLLVKLNVLIMSTWSGVRWSIWYWAFGDDLFYQTRFWVDVFALFSWNISYMCLYDLGYLLYNPFKSRKIDLAHECISSGLLTLSQRFAKGDCVPPTM